MSKSAKYFACLLVWMSLTLLAYAQEDSTGTYPITPESKVFSKEEISKPAGLDPRVSPNVIVNDRNDGRRGLMQSETVIAVIDGVVVVAFNDSRGFFNPNTSVVGWGYSLDDGNSFIDGQNLPAGSFIRNGDPWITTDGQGNFWLAALYQSFAGVAAHEGGVDEEGVLNWDGPSVAVEGDSNTIDKDAIAVDNALGTIYVTYTRPFSGRIELVRSLDGGLAWGTPTLINTTSGNIGSIPIVGLNNELYVVWENGWPFGSRNVQIAQSVDGGESFSPPVTIASLTSFSVPGFNRGSVADFPSIAIDKSEGPGRGTIYVAFHSQDLGDADVFITKSTDGINWIDPVRVNDDPVGNGALQFYPAIAVDNSGNVGVLFFDRRNDPGTAWTDVYFARSTDGLVSFEENIKVTDVTSNWSATTSDGVPNFGDFIGLASQGRTFYAAWGDGRNGDPDAYFAKIAP